MLFRKTLTHCSENQGNTLDALGEQSARFQNVQPGGIYSNHWVLKGYCDCYFCFRRFPEISQQIQWFLRFQFKYILNHNNKEGFSDYISSLCDKLSCSFYFKLFVPRIFSTYGMKTNWCHYFIHTEHASRADRYSTNGCVNNSTNSPEDGPVSPKHVETQQYTNKIVTSVGFHSIHK